MRIGDDVGRHQVDQAAEGPNPHAALDEAALNLAHADGPLHLNHANRPENAYLLHTRQIGAGRKPSPQRRLYAADIGLPVGCQEQLDAGVGNRARQRVGHEGGAVHKDPGISRGDGVSHLAAGQGGGERHVAPRQRLADRHDVRCDARVLAGEQAAAAAESGRDLIGDQQHPMAIA